MKRNETFETCDETFGATHQSGNGVLGNADAKVPTRIVTAAKTSAE